MIGKRITAVLLAVTLALIFFSVSCKNLEYPEGNPNPNEEIPQEEEGNFHIYLFIGQSNMAGRAAMEPSDMLPVANALLFDDQDEWVAAVAPFNRFSSVEAPADARLNPTYTFLQTVTAANPDIEFGAVVNARGGTSIEQWAQGATDGLFEEAVKRCRKAMESGTLKGILWHQGESNGNDANYAVKLAALVANLRRELGKPNVPFIAGETFYALGSNDRRVVNEQIALAKTTIANYDYITSIGTDAHDVTTHFDAYSQRLLGYRYAQKINKIVYGLSVDEEPPSVPAGLRVQSSTAYSVALAWDAASDNSGTIGYEVFRSPEASVNKAVASVAGTTCIITALVPGSSYDFTVRAFDRAGNISAKSAPVQQTLPGNEPVPGGALFAWDSAGYPINAAVAANTIVSGGYGGINFGAFNAPVAADGGALKIEGSTGAKVLVIGATQDSAANATGTGSSGNGDLVTVHREGQFDLSQGTFRLTVEYKDYIQGTGGTALMRVQINNNSGTERSVLGTASMLRQYNAADTLTANGSDSGLTYQGDGSRIILEVTPSVRFASASQAAKDSLKTAFIAIRCDGNNITITGVKLEEVE